MARIFYGVNGEGLGHASRTMSVIEHLPEHEIHVFTYGKALKFFEDAKHPNLHEIHGLTFSYRNGSVDYWGTVKSAWHYYLNLLPLNLRQIKLKKKSLKPSLFISDFEPSVPRAVRADAKLISIDNQHRFAYADMIRLPWWLRVYGWACGAAAKLMVPSPDHTIISTFHWDKIKVRKHNVTLTNGLLRKEIEDRQPRDEGYVLVYLRDSVSEKVLKAIEFLPYRFVVFGASMSPTASRLTRNSNFTFLPLSKLFIKYLANCTCVISTSGNQLLTEARFWKKPVLAVPEPGQHEQAINANYASYLNMGRTIEADKLTPEKVAAFLVNWRHCCYARHEPHVNNGVHKVVEIIRNYL